MTDVLSRQERSRLMSKVKGRHTKPEMIVRKALHARGFRYRLHDRRIFGHPDLLLPKYHAAVFVHGCFWHHHERCKFAYMPKSKVDFWQAKFVANRERDLKVQARLLTEGWRVLVIWECALKDAGQLEASLLRIEHWLKSKSLYEEIA
ncbi:very short patch repair endonuclease [Gallaecimonas xiamenensis]|nr:very short patch repair endonuclease [Gallaecimonas xiamenensis]